MQRNRPGSEQTRQFLVPCLALVAAAIALRAWLAIDDHSVFWPDEIHQSVEQAHRAVFGYGLLSWEFRDGARSWLFPGAIAALWKLADLLGVSSSLALMTLARLAMVAGSGAAIWFAAKLASTRGPRAALAAAVVLCTFPPAVVFSYRTMSETASAPLIVIGAWFWTQRGTRPAMYAGLALATACLLRYQNGIFVLVFGAALLLQRRWRDFAGFVGIGATVAAAGGLLDWITWGRPFHSLLAYIDFNLVQSGASSFGVEPFGFYATTLWTSVGPFLPVIVVCFAVGAFLKPVLGGAVLAFFLAHSVLPHKEIRFLVPCLPLLAAVAGVGAEHLLRRLRAPHVIAAATAVAMSISFVVVLTHLQFQDLGQYRGTERASLSVWNSEEDPTLLLADAGKREDLCGVALIQGRAAFTGGYSYLHRDVPLLYQHQLCEAESANYVIGPIANASLLSSTYSLQTQRGDWGLYRRAGSCKLSAHFDDMLEGARDMGLQREHPQQDSDGALRIDLRRHAGAFTSGWGNGEQIDCQAARWAASKHALIEFDLEPPGPQFLLQLRLRAHELATPQRFAVIVNGRRVHVGPLPPRFEDVDVELPDGALRAGKNQIEFAFARSARGGANDHRELAALFHSIEIVPSQDDFSIDVSQADATLHLIRGFHPTESAGDSAFAWSDGPVSEIEGVVAWPRSPYVLSVVAEAIPLVRSQRARVLVNDQLAGSMQFRTNWSTERLIIPASALSKGRNRVRFEYEATARPATINARLSDRRDLAVRFSRIELSPMEATQEIDFGTQNARPFLVEGWSSDERDGERTFVWSDGSRATAALSFAGVEHPVLRLSADGYTDALPVNVTVVVDGLAAATFAAPDGWQDLSIPLHATDPAKAAQLVTFEFDRTGKPSDRSPKTSDRRSLALRVDRMWVEGADESSVRTSLRTMKPNPEPNVAESAAAMR